MSGKMGTGYCIENICDFEKIDNYMNLRIKSIVINIITLDTSKHFHILKVIGKFLQNFFHPLLSPTLSHFSIQLNMENDKDIFLIEYGAYYRGDNIHHKTNSSFASSISSEYIGYVSDETPYFFLNEDGVRLSKLNYEKFFYNRDPTKYQRQVVKLQINEALLEQYLLNDDNEIEKYRKKYKDGLKSVECEIKNKVTLGELMNHFKGEEWTASKYILGFHDCQNFAAEVIRYLKAIRINEYDTLRIREKKLFPNCIIRALKENESLNEINILGQIPVIGLVFDIGYKIGYNLNNHL